MRTMSIVDNIIREGRAEIIGGDKVFYNHIQQFNRDLSVMVIKSWHSMYHEHFKAKKRSHLDEPKIDNDNHNYINILEALSATGLRSVRYAKELDHVNKIVANDLLPDAVKLINDNIKYNNLQDKVVANHGDAIKYMGSTNMKFHVVDLDPYGTAMPFIDGAIQCIKDEGILLVTCTDAGVLAGSGYPEKCYSLYGGNNFGSTAMSSESNHEVGIRLILNTVAQTAAKYKKAIEPLLSLSIDYYFRLVIKVRTSAIEVKNLASNTMLTYHCTGCGDKFNQFLGRKQTGDGKLKFQYPKVTLPGGKCEFCESPFHLAGPMYGGKIHNETFLDHLVNINDEADANVYGTKERIKGMLTLAKTELDTPFYFNLNQLSSFFKTAPISINDFATALGNLNHKVSLTHAKKNCIKTTASWEDVLQVNKQWLIKCNKQLVDDYDNGKLTKTDKLTAKVETLRANPAQSLNLSENMIGHKILANLKSDKTVDFVLENQQASDIKKLRSLKMIRFQENPKNWGPKARPK